MCLPAQPLHKLSHHFEVLVPVHEPGIIMHPSRQLKQQLILQRTLLVQSHYHPCRRDLVPLSSDKQHLQVLRQILHVALVVPVVPQHQTGEHSQLWVNYVGHVQYRGERVLDHHPFDLLRQGRVAQSVEHHARAQRLPVDYNFVAAEQLLLLKSETEN